jgi:hypothetical protein
MKSRDDRCFRTDELRERNLRQRIFDNFVQTDDYRANAAIAFVDAYV